MIIYELLDAQHGIIISVLKEEVMVAEDMQLLWDSPEISQCLQNRQK